MSTRITLPLIPLRGTTLLPGVTVPVMVGRTGSLRALEAAGSQGQREILVVAQRTPKAEVSIEDLYDVGVRANVAQLQTGQRGIQAVLEGLDRYRLLEVRKAQGGHLEAVAIPLPDVSATIASDPMFAALEEQLRRRASELAKLRGVPKPIVERISELQDGAGAFTHLVAHHLELELSERQRLLEMQDLGERMRAVLVHVERELAKLEAQQEIQNQVHAELGERQKEVFLREQLKAIQRELGDGSEEDELEVLRERLEALDLPPTARKEVDRELARLQRAGRESMDSQVIRNYLEWVAELPWNKRSTDVLDLAGAEDILNRDHYGLSDVKDRVLELLAVRALQAKRADRLPVVGSAGEGNATADNAPEPQIAHDGEADQEPPLGDRQLAASKAVARGPILLFSGPPGVGKTSVGKSIAAALGRKYVRIALGGVRDEADIRGHRRTYVGAMPGRIIQALKQAGTRNPVILLDEVDKLGVSYQGNPASALLEVLDPAQNSTFTDHYLNVPFDLSEVLFIATANYVDNIPAPLRDRMEAIPFSGYTDREKVEIARQHLIPRQLEENGLSGENVTIEENAVMDVVTRYTHESGVRQLERAFGKLCRKLARRISREQPIPTPVMPDDVRDMLGRPRVRPERAAATDEVGVATGMYYTPAGGDIMFVEASVRRLMDFRNADTSMQVSGWGNVSLILTGQLGDVMKESARAALTYAATRAGEFAIPEERVGSIEAHIHVPAGAIPKDGPSAGIAMATALISAMSGRALRRDVAMTGEITLRGRVLPIGGVKEKLLGAHRAGIKHVLLPAENEPDLEDLPEDVLDALKVTCVSTLDEVVAIALSESEARETQPPTATPMH